MPKLSIIIVSYNVKYFLDQLLQSIQKSVTDFDYEVIVVDNNSPDRSSEYIGRKFPEIKLLANSHNIGYAAANNQGIKICQGAYVLLLNPDTLIQQDTLQKSVDFLEAHADAGSVGVKMLDGAGNYLPESKRGFPTPWVSFCKMLGLQKLFPNSAKFNSYYLGHLDSTQVHEVDVLTGAFILIRRHVLEEINGLDEQYFMYGEDVDISYKIKKTGYKNYYLPETQIIHYKGESTNSESLSRNFNFYKAMILFTETHLASDWSLIKKMVIRFSIILAAIIGFFAKRISMLLPYLIEFTVFLIGIITIKNVWAIWMHGDVNYYESIFDTFNAPLYAFVWLLLLVFSGSYDRYPKWRNTVLGAVLGLATVLMIYALLPYTLRSSRPIIFLSFAWILISTVMVRGIWNYFREGKWLSIWGTENNVLIFGLEEEVKRAHGLFLDLNQQSDRVVHLILDPEMDDEMIFFKINLMLKEESIDDLIICNKGLDFNFVIGLMGKLKSRARFKLLPEYSSTIIGSDSSRRKGQIYTLDINFGIINPVQKRLKRLLDLGIFASLIIVFPLLLYFVFRRNIRLRDILDIISGHGSWVGYDRKDPSVKELPKLKKGIFPITALYKIPLDKDGVHQINRSYALNYSVLDDIRVLFSSI